MPHYLECFKENVFTWQNAETLEETTFAVDRIQPWVEANNIEIVATPVDPVWAVRFLEDRGIETHRLQLLTPECFNTPVIYCDMGDGTHLLVDGHHRYVYAATTQNWWIPAVILLPDQWAQFVVTGLPKFGADHLRTSFSGIV